MELSPLSIKDERTKLDKKNPKEISLTHDSMANPDN
jgi:hypothetical protein